MQQQNNQVERQQVGNNSLQSYKTTSITRNERGETFISRYTGELTPQTVSKSIAKVKASFPQLPPEFYNVLIDRVKNAGFCDERLIDSVNYVIDNCIYPNPTIANFISFDKKKQLYTYVEVCDLIDKGDKMENFEIVEIDGKKWRARK